jgi:hypothetical protein
MKTLILNSTNLVADGQNNKLIYKFPNSVQFRKSQIAFAGCSMYYSWFNITSSLVNNTFSYNWINGAGVATTYTITIPDGLYEVSTLNQYLQFEFIRNGHYLVNSGQNVYYAQFTINAPRYAVQIDTFLFPTSLPVGWTNPASVPFPPQTFNPIITLPAKVNEILGYVAGFATAQNLNNSFVAPVGSQFVSKLGNGTISYISTTAPNVQPNSSLLFSLSGVDNAYANPTSIIYTLVPQVAIGEVINDKPPEFIWNKLIDGTYNQLTLTILGTDLNLIKINDPAMTIVLVIKDADEMGMKF